MLDMFFGAICVGLILFALLVLAYGVLLKCTMPKKKFHYYIVVPTTSANDDVVALAYSARMKLGFIGDDEYGRVVILNHGMEEHQLCSARTICRESNGIYLCDYETFEELTK